MKPSTLFVYRKSTPLWEDRTDLSSPVYFDHGPVAKRNGLFLNYYLTSFSSATNANRNIPVTNWSYIIDVLIGEKTYRIRPGDILYTFVRDGEKQVYQPNEDYDLLNLLDKYRFQTDLRPHPESESRILAGL